MNSIMSMQREAPDVFNRKFSSRRRRRRRVNIESRGCGYKHAYLNFKFQFNKIEVPKTKQFLGF